MIDIPPDVLARFDARLIREPVQERLHPFYRKWLRFYFDFCYKYQHDVYCRQSLPPFLKKLTEKKQSPPYRKQAAHAVSIFHDSSQEI